jgi:uncharacterized membrane-anchored protein
MRTILFAAFGLATLGVDNGLIYQKELLLREGRVVFLRLAPRDPRSLMQGDYMALNYDIANKAQQAGASGFGRKGQLVVKLDAKGIADFVRIHTGRPLAAGEQLIPYKLRKWGRVDVGPDAYFFQEGHAKLYERAKYGELRVDSAGRCLLVGLRGESLEPLGPPR